MSGQCAANKPKENKVPDVKLSNGQTIPIYGLGTWKSPPGAVGQAVKDAIELGYRHIDCAHVYENEKEIGAALQEVFKQGTVKREDLFITSKLWLTFLRPDLVEGALRTTLANLQVDYVDLYLIHWPMAYKVGPELFPFDKDGKLQFDATDYVDTWKALEKCQKKGLTKSLGLSNFNSKQIDRVLAVAEIPPVVDQVECHPYLNQKKLIDFCASKNIKITAYSPLGSGGTVKPDKPQLMDDARIKEIAAKYNKTPAQILLRWNVQRGNITIPKSVTKTRIAENFDIFNFELSPADMDLIDTFDCKDGRILSLDAALEHPHYPFREPF